MQRERCCHKLLRHDATVGESVGNSLPSSEVVLQNTLSVMQSLARSALQNTVQAPVQNVRPRVKADMLTYSGYDDCKSTEYLDRLLHYQQTTGLSDTELLEQVAPVSLTEQAARWFQLTGHCARMVEEFSGEFLLANSEWRLRRELQAG
ncbi:hypothetical protein HPB51_019610 [Rhipicephalus microplus]|uniref:Uncharacterized protein n=1 Tax=Rhipicephalus microplus TaxID=6941 RepID=A0A9J6DJ96_RHIMP|nr:hypothetical protein HPB51_019610 [Rhipicephalus microplus]